MCGCARRIQGVLVVFHVDGGGLPEVVGGGGVLRGVLRVEGGLGVWGLGEGGGL